MLIERKKSLKPGVHVDREYIQEDEKKRRLLRPVLKSTWDHDKYRGKCKLEGTTLVIQGKKYGINNLHELPDELSTFNVSSKSTDAVIGFFGELNPLSNFHPAKFTHNGFAYHCSEQMIQHEKALYFKDSETANAIMKYKSGI